MKAVDLAKTSPTLADILQLASEENVVLAIAEGRQFVLAEIDDFAQEVAATCGNELLMRLLSERSREPAKYSLEEVRKQLTKRKKRG